MASVQPPMTGVGLNSTDFPPLKSKSLAKNPGSSLSNLGSSSSAANPNDAQASGPSTNPKSAASSSSIPGSSLLTSSSADSSGDQALGSHRDSTNPRSATSSSVAGMAAPLGGVQACAEGKSSWSSLFCSGTAPKLQFHMPTVTNGKPSVFIFKDIHHKGMSVRKECLVGQIMGTPPSVSQVQDVASQLWGRRHRVDVLRLESGFFLFQFENLQTRD